jgi:hypothetical protein
MELITKELKEAFKKHPLYSTEDTKLLEKEIIVKYFNPYGVGTWLIVEGQEQEDGDYLLFGLCYLTEWELGYITLKQLEEIRDNKQLMSVERDLYLTEKTIGDYLEANDKEAYDYYKKLEKED